MDDSNVEKTEAPKPVKAQEVLTEVTSVADQELKTGKKIEIDPSDLVENAKRTFIPVKRHFMQIYSAMSGRGRERVISALLDLPMDNLRVLLKDKMEIEAYRLGQQVLWCRQLILTDAIKKEKLRIDAEKAKVSEESADKSNSEVNESQQQESTNE